MATAEASPSTLGPRYAPDDPTLPEPWKGLIDGSTGLLYYWNPETNVTQYEKPTSVPPPLPPGPPPKMNPIPGARSSQSENVQTPLSQQNIQAQPSHVQLHGSHLGSAMQHGHLAPEQVRPQMTQQPGQQVPSQSGQMPMQPGQHVSMQPGQGPYPHMQQMPPFQQGQMYPGAQMGTPHGFQFSHQYAQYTMPQQNMPSQGPPSSSEQSQHLSQGQQLPPKHEHNKIDHGPRDDTDSHQGIQPGFSPAHRHLMQGQQFPHMREQKAGIPHRDDNEFQHVNQAGFSPAQIQQTGTPVQSLPLKMSIQSNQNTQYGGPFANVQPNNPPSHLQQTGTELTRPPHVSRFQTQMGPGKMHGQHQNVPPVGSNMPYEENHFGRPANEYIYNASKDANAAPHQQPKLAQLPMSRSQQVN